VEMGVKFAAIFPGQGSQVVGMGADVAEKSSAARCFFDRAAATLGYDLLELQKHGPEAKLRETQFSQPAIFVTNLALYYAGGETLKLFATTHSADLNSFVNRTLKAERATYPTQYVWTNRNYLVCNGRHTGRNVIWTGSTHGRSMVWEQLFALWGSDGYVVTYARPQKNPPSNVARSSLVSICGVGSAPEQPGGMPVVPANNQPPVQGQPAPPQPDQPAPYPSGTIPHPYVPVIPN